MKKEATEMRKRAKAAVLAVIILTAVLVTACGGGEEPGMSRDFAGTTWSTSDGSYLVLGEPGTENGFMWYRDPDVKDDNYYAGNYTLYRGKEGIRYITEDLADYGVTKEELDRVISSGDYREDDFVAMTVTYSSFVLDGEEKVDDPEGVAISYYGFKDGDELGLVNMNTGGFYVFTPAE